MHRKPWIRFNNEIMIKKDDNFQFDKDLEALNLYLSEYIIPKTKKFYSIEEQIHYMIDQKYYINFLEMYTIDKIISLFNHIKSKNFQFSSFMSASKFYQSYALWDYNHEFILEHYEDRISIVALYLAQGNIDKAFTYAELLINQEYQPATPTFLNAGRYNAGKLVSCFLEEMGDNLSSISYIFDSSMKLSSIGGGISINLSKIRARGEAIKGIANRASGVMPIMKILEDIFSYANQLGQRPGAGAVYLSIFHYDIYEFLECKKINVDEKVRIKSLSTGVIIPDKFFELAGKNIPMYVFAPHSVYTEYNQYLEEMDMSEMYDDLVANPNVIKKQVDARELIIEIAKTQKESGYPYLFFKENANKDHALKNIGEIKFSNLCTEIMQLSEVSDITHYYQEDTIRRGISCNLGSLNITNVMDHKNISSAVRIAMDMLTDVTDLTNIDIVPSIKKANDELHSVGLGAMNLHGYFAKNHISYESDEALEFCDIFFMMINYYSLERSMEIAKERKKTFKDFDKSEYANGNYFDKYIKQNYTITSSKIAKLFEEITIPNQDDWKRLKENIMQYGLYHAYRLAIAPNQSTAYVMNATPSVMPVVNLIEVRENNEGTTFYPMPYLTNSNILFYKSAYNMSPEKILKLVSTIQNHIDQGISTILFMDSTVSTRELGRIYILAHRLGLKSLYYTRTRKSLIDECFTCSV